MRYYSKYHEYGRNGNEFITFQSMEYFLSKSLRKKHYYISFPEMVKLISIMCPS